MLYLCVVWSHIPYTPLACGPGSPELSKSDPGICIWLVKFTFTFKFAHEEITK